MLKSGTRLSRQNEPKQTVVPIGNQPKQATIMIIYLLVLQVTLHLIIMSC